jgi:hypothetical protein
MKYAYMKARRTHLENTYNPMLKNKLQSLSYDRMLSQSYCETRILNLQTIHYLHAHVFVLSSFSLQQIYEMTFIERHGVAIYNSVFPTAAAWVRAQVRSCGICGGQSGTEGRFSPSTSVSPANSHSTDCSTLIQHPGLVQ